MKTTGFNLAVVAFVLCAATFISCSKDQLSVDDVPVSGISLDTQSLTLAVGKEQTLTATVTPDDATNKTVTWASSSTAIATVSSVGKVTAVSAGSTTITAKAGNKTATCAVTIVTNDIPVTGISLDSLSLTLSIGDEHTLTATVTPNDATNKTVTWTSSSTAIATVTAAGKVTAVSEGTTIITAKAGDQTATCAVTVNPKVVAVTGISLDSLSLRLDVGKEYTLIATVTPDNATDKTVTWTSDATDVATVSVDGKVTAVSSGLATITAKAGDKTATCAVTVPVSVDAKGLTPDIHAIIPNNMLNAIIGMGMPIYGGDNPPANLEGTYLVSPEVMVANNATNDFPIGTEFSGIYLTFANQNNSNQTISVTTYEESDKGPVSGEGLKAYLVGSDNKFTVFVPINKVQTETGHSYNTVGIYSGIIATGGIQNCYYTTCMVSGGGTEWGLMPDGRIRIFKDKDGFSEKTEITRSSKITIHGTGIYPDACEIEK